MAEHLTDVQSSDSHTVKPWFTGRLDFTIPVKDFASEGFPLVGGRLDYINGKAVAALVYKRNRHVVNVFVSPVAPNLSAQAKSARGFAIVEAEANGLRFTAVSDLNRDDLDRLLELLTK
jgi:anti-sigma factor RsiW